MWRVGCVHFKLFCPDKTQSLCTSLPKESTEILWRIVPSMLHSWNPLKQRMSALIPGHLQSREKELLPDCMPSMRKCFAVVFPEDQ